MIKLLVQPNCLNPTHLVGERLSLLPTQGEMPVKCLHFSGQDWGVYVCVFNMMYRLLKQDKEFLGQKNKVICRKIRLASNVIKHLCLGHEGILIAQNVIPNTTKHFLPQKWLYPFTLQEDNGRRYGSTQVKPSFWVLRQQWHQHQKHL